MARVTVEDCIEKVPNRFHLVVLAAKRAREISAGASIAVARDNDKNPVVALREIAEEAVNFKVLKENIIKGLQRNIFTEDMDKELEEELQDSMTENGWSSNFSASVEDSIYVDQQETDVSYETGNQTT